MSTIIDKECIERLAHEAGFDLCGVTRAEPLGERCEEQFLGWLQGGNGDGLEYLHRNIDLRLDPSKIVEEGRSVILCGVNYKSPISLSEGQVDGAKIASYALMRDYHKTIKRGLKSLFNALQQIYPTLEGRPFVDSAPLLEKELAVRSGLGWIGRQSLLITPQYGSFVLLGELVINAKVDRYSEPYGRSSCGECRLCIDSCPAKAIREDRTIDARRCISAHTVEGIGQGEGDSDGWIFGCDSCQSCCPHNQRTPLATNPNFKPSLTPPSREEWLAMNEEEFLRLVAGTPLKRSSLERIRIYI